MLEKPQTTVRMRFHSVVLDQSRLQPVPPIGLQLLELLLQQKVRVQQCCLYWVAKDCSGVVLLALLQVQVHLPQNTGPQAGQQLPEQLPWQLHLKALQQVLMRAPHTSCAAEVALAMVVLVLLRQAQQQELQQPICLQQLGQLPRRLLERAGRSQAGLPTHCRGLGWELGPELEQTGVQR